MEEREIELYVSTYLYKDGNHCFITYNQRKQKICLTFHCPLVEYIKNFMIMLTNEI